MASRSSNEEWTTRSGVLLLIVLEFAGVFCSLDMFHRFRAGLSFRSVVSGFWRVI